MVSWNLQYIVVTQPTNLHGKERKIRFLNWHRLLSRLSSPSSTSSIAGCPTKDHTTSSRRKIGDFSAATRMANGDRPILMGGSSSQDVTSSRISTARAMSTGISKRVKPPTSLRARMGWACSTSTSTPINRGKPTSTEPRQSSKNCFRLATSEPLGAVRTAT